ncbi:hypothetical protein D3C85_716480 [compost metagenome]
MAMGGAFWQQVGAAGFFQGQVDRDRLGLVVLLFGQPAPGQYRARTDAADQRRRALEFPECRLQRPPLQQAVLGQDHLHDLRGTATTQGNQLLVAQLLFIVDRNHHLGERCRAGNDPGHGRAVRRRQHFQGRFGGGAVPVPVATAEYYSQHHQSGQYIPPGASNH